MRAVCVEEFLERMCDGSLRIFDVRSPAEFARGTIPGAVSLPLFDDVERHTVGLTYHQRGRAEAIKVGLELVGPKLRWFVETVERSLGESRSVGLFCWRGGMRSSALAWLLEFCGFDVITLQGGYKAFRRFVLATFEQPRTIILLSGYTGSGKTELLHQLQEHGETAIDLEQLACHRGSAFGGVGMPPQPTQQQFENLLALELWKHRHAERIWLEDESRWIGELLIPAPLWEQMQRAPIIAINIPLEQRIERLVAQYGSAPRSELHRALDAIRSRLGAERYQRAKAALEAGDYATVARVALEHYDKSYRHGLKKRAERITWIDAPTPHAALTELLRFACVPAHHLVIAA